MDVYKSVSRQIHEIFHEYTDVIEPISLDEAFLDVTENKPGILLAVDIAREIKRKVRERLSLVASAGVSYNKFLAKIASDYRKPDGLCTIHPDQALDFIAHLPIESFWGVGPVTARKMHVLGIHTGGQLRACSQAMLLRNSFPAVLSMFAVYRLLRPMGLINHRTGLILIYTGTMAVFSLWNIKGYFDTVPVEIEEAARMDGANPLQVVTRIVLPLAKPSIVVTALMVLIYVWNEYIYATTFMTGEENYTLAAGLYALQATEMSGSWPVFAAASITVSIPVLIIFFLCQKHMTSGLTAGGVKG